MDNVPRFHRGWSVVWTCSEGKGRVNQPLPYLLCIPYNQLPWRLSGWLVFLHRYDVLIQLPLIIALAKRIGKHNFFPEISNQHCSLCPPDSFWVKAAHWRGLSGSRRWTARERETERCQPGKSLHMVLALYLLSFSIFPLGMLCKIS